MFATMDLIGYSVRELIAIGLRINRSCFLWGDNNNGFGVRMVEDGSTQKVEKGFIQHLMLDVSVGVGVAAFAASMWGVANVKQLAVSAGIGVAAACIVYGLYAFIGLFTRLIFPAEEQPVEADLAVKPKPEREPDRSEERVVPIDVPREKPPAVDPVKEGYSVTDVEPRTVSIAAAPLATPPFPKEWTEDLIETLEWKVFDDLCIAFWEAQGNSVLDHSKGSSDAASFFISAKNRSNTRIGVIQSRSSQANKASVIEMQNLLRMKKQSELPIAIFMYAGRISNVVSSYCQSHGIRLFGSHNIHKGIMALPKDKQKELMKSLIRPDYMLPTCPNCNIKMVKRKRKDTGRIFWGCLSYPECRETIEYSPYF